jgi:ureidoacrylate peracid hydrolase
LIKGSEGAEVYKGLPQPLDSEEIIEKHRYSVFYQTHLELFLRDMGVDTLIITGLHSNICAQTTSRDGFQRDFKIVFVSDGTAANPPVLHEAGCLEIMVAFGRVLSTDEVMQEIKSNS